MKNIDLHIHTTLSDGLLTPEEVVEKAISKNCSFISITDHDWIQDYSFIEKLYNIPIITGIEFNTSYKNMHLLGYLINDIKNVQDEMINLKKINYEVCLEVIRLLQKDGFDISLESINEYLKENNLSTSYIDKRKIVKYLMYKGYSDDVKSTYDNLIGVNQKYYVPNKKLTPTEVINIIKDNNGIAILAHPNTLNLDPDGEIAIIKNLLDSGLDGIEVINGRMAEEQINRYQKIGDDFNIITTVGSDFHDERKDSLGITVTDEFYNKLTRRLR